MPFNNTWTLKFTTQPVQPVLSKFQFSMPQLSSARLRKQGCLRTFAQKSSNIDFFYKTSAAATCRLWVTFVRNEKNWGVTDFVSEIRYLKGHPNFEKSVYLICISVCLKILQMNLSNRIFCANFYMSRAIKQIKTTGSILLSKFNL